jgi:hypothetical protein
MRQRRMLMFTCRPAGLATLISAVIAAMLPVWLAGCGSKQAVATANSTPGNGLDSAISTAAENSAGKPRPKLKPGAKTAVLERAGDRPYDKTFDDLRFEIKPGDKFRREMLTSAIEELHGKNMRIRGYILPTAQSRGIKNFVLVRDNKECCFGPGAALYDCILVEMAGSAAAEFSIWPVTVEGKFEIREFVVGDKHMAIYHIDGESVR